MWSLKAEFNEKSQLVEYIFPNHESKKTFKCEICKADFAEKTHTDHVAMVHEGLSLFKSEICSAKLKEKMAEWTCFCY